MPRGQPAYVKAPVCACCSSISRHEMRKERGEKIAHDGVGRRRMLICREEGGDDFREQLQKWIAQAVSGLGQRGFFSQAGKSQAASSTRFFL